MSDNIEIEMFTCPNHTGNLRLTASSCAGMWQRAKSERYSSFSRVNACCGCSIGSKNAGEPDDHERRHGSVDLICTRCHTAADRFIHGSICVSCYNRGREVMLGKNARGSAPKRLRPLIDIAVSYLDSGVLRRIQVTRVVDAIEARLRCIRKNSHVIRFVHTASPLSDQMDMFGAVLPTGSHCHEKHHRKHAHAKRTGKHGQREFFVNG